MEIEICPFILTSIFLGCPLFPPFETGQALPRYLLDWLIDQEINLNWVFRGIGDMFLTSDLTSDSHKIVWIKPLFEENVQQMLDDFEKFPILKHRILSEYYSFLPFLLNLEREGK